MKSKSFGLAKPKAVVVVIVEIRAIDERKKTKSFTFD